MPSKPLHDILKAELQAKNEQIAILQAVLADQAQRLQLAQMRDSPESLPPITGSPVGGQQASAPAELERKHGFWHKIFGK